MTDIYYRNVNTSERLRDLLGALTDDPAYVAFDVETNGLNPYRDDAAVVSISLTFPSELTWVVPLWHPEGPWGGRWRDVLGQIARTLVDHAVPLVAHNFQFDARWVEQHTGVGLSHLLLWDTMACAHVLDENQSKKLKNLAAPLMGGDWGIDVAAAWMVPWFDLAKYNAQDTIATARLMEQQAQVLSAPSNADLSRLWSTIVLPACKVLADVTHEGILLDRDRWRAALDEADTEVIKAESWLELTAVEYGDPPDVTVSWEPTAKWFLWFTEQAVQRDELQVLETTGTGRPSWGSAVLKRLARDGSEVAETLLRYRHGSKQVQFLSSWDEEADDRGRIHASFNIARTSTGRLSSSDPNMQQVSRELKTCFRATPGWKFVEIDYSQIEVRIVAEYIHQTVCPDNPMMQVYLRGGDIYVESASQVLGIPIEEVDGSVRRRFKPVVLGLNYNMGAVKFVDYARDSYGVDFTLDEAKIIVSGYFEWAKGLGEWHEWQRQTAARYGYVTTLTGRRRRLPEVFSKDGYLRSQAQRQAINSPVQGTASDLMLSALGRIHTEVDRQLCRIVGTVHDSVLLEVRDTSVVDLVCDIMLASPVTLSVPLAVDASIGDRWGEYDITYTRSTT